MSLNFKLEVKSEREAKVRAFTSTLGGETDGASGAPSEAPSSELIVSFEHMIEYGRET